MRNLILLFFVVFCALANAQQGKVIKGVKFYRIISNSKLEFKKDAQNNFYAEIVKGNDFVFEYLKSDDKHTDRTDDEHFERILFAVNKNKKKFYYSDTTLKAAFLIGCFCRERGWYTFSDGFIKGEKINTTTWKVEFDAMTKPDPSRLANAITRKFIANFTPHIQKVLKKNDPNSHH